MAATAGPFACARARSCRLIVGGLRLHLLEWGEPGRPALCFLHGGSAHAHWFDGVVSAVAGGYHVISLDQRGHGQSAWPRPPAYRTEDFAADLLGVFDALGWERPVIAGHSMGGHNALAFAACHPERVRALVIVDSRPSIPPERLAGMHQRGRRALRRYPTREAAVAAFRLLPRETVAAPALLEHLARAGVARRDGAFVYRFDPAASGSRQPADGWPLLPRIAAPTLIVRAERSPILPREMAEQMRAMIPRATLVELPGAYHHLMLDAPQAFASVLGAFLGSLPS